MPLFPCEFYPNPIQKYFQMCRPRLFEIVESNQNLSWTNLPEVPCRPNFFNIFTCFIFRHPKIMRIHINFGIKFVRASWQECGRQIMMQYFKEKNRGRFFRRALV